MPELNLLILDPAWQPSVMLDLNFWNSERHVLLEIDLHPPLSKQRVKLGVPQISTVQQGTNLHLYVYFFTRLPNT